MQEVGRKLEDFDAESNFEALFANYLSEVRVEDGPAQPDEDESAHVPFVGNLFQTFRERIERVIQLVVGNLGQSKSVLKNYYSFQHVFSGKFKKEVKALRESHDLRKILGYFGKIRQLEALYEELPARRSFPMFEVSLEKVNNILRNKLTEEKAHLEAQVDTILSGQATDLLGKYKQIENRLKAPAEVYTELHELEIYVAKLDKELLSLVQRSQVFFKKVVMVFKEKIFKERRGSLMNMCRELKNFPQRIRKAKRAAQKRLREARKTMIQGLGYAINSFQLDVESLICEFAKMETRVVVFEDCKTNKKEIQQSKDDFESIKARAEEISLQFEILHKKKFEYGVLSRFRLKAEPYYSLWGVCFDFIHLRKDMLQQDIAALPGIRLEQKRAHILCKLAEFQETFLKSFSQIQSDEVHVDKAQEQPVGEEEAAEGRSKRKDSQKKSLFVMKERNVNNLMKMKDSLQSEIQAFEKYVPLLEILIRTQLDVRHWLEIQQKLGKEFDLDALNIKNVSSYLDDQDIEVVRQVAKKARKEKKVDRVLSETVEKFQGLRLDVDESNVKKRFDIARLEKVETVLEDESIRMDRVINLRKEKYQKARLVEISRLLRRSLELVRKVKDTQSLLEELKVVFEGDEIRNHLEKTWKRFEVEEREFRESLRAVEMRGSLEAVIKTEGIPILRMFQKLHQQLTQIKQDVWSYLQNKRLRFPRFFCLDDQELFSLLRDYGSDRGIRTIQRFLPKMFLTVNSFLMNNQKKNIICGVSHDPWSGRPTHGPDERGENYLVEDFVDRRKLFYKEDLKFSEEIEVQRFILEDLMNKIEQSISDQLIRRVKSRLNAYMRLVATSAQARDADLRQWINECTSQEVFICFSIIIAKKLQTLKGRSKDFESLLAFLDAKIEFLGTLYSKQGVPDRLVTPKFLNLLCFLCRCLNQDP